MEILGVLSGAALLLMMVGYIGTLLVMDIRNRYHEYRLRRLVREELAKMQTGGTDERVDTRYADYYRWWQSLRSRRAGASHPHLNGVDKSHGL